MDIMELEALQKLADVAHSADDQIAREAERARTGQLPRRTERSRRQMRNMCENSTTTLWQSHLRVRQQMDKVDLNVRVVFL